MARIRTIKPEFWDSPGIETIEPIWRLLYIAMWNWADDTGRGKAEARELMGFVFPRDEDMTLGEFRRGLGEVRRVFGVKFYKVGGRSYYAIPSWDRHQKIDKRSGSRWPGPEEGEEYDPVAENRGIMRSPSQFDGDSEGSAEDPPRVRRDPVAGTGEQGNRGTGEALVTSRTDASPEHSVKNATLRIVNAWTDGIPPAKRPPQRTVLDIEAQIRPMVQQGINHADIAAGLAEWWAGKYPPTTLPNYVARAQQGQKPGMATGTSRAQDILAIDTSTIGGWE